MYTLRESRRGGDELRTSVYPSNFAPIATKLRQRAFHTICKFRFFDAPKIFFAKFFGFFFGFSSFSVDFRGARLFLTSKSSSSRFFALDGQIFRSVRPLGLIFRFCTVRTSTCQRRASPKGTSGGRASRTPPPDPLIDILSLYTPSGSYAASADLQDRGPVRWPEIPVEGLDCETERRTNGFGWVLMDSGGFWWILEGSGGFWRILLVSAGFWWILMIS